MILQRLRRLWEISTPSYQAHQKIELFKEFTSETIKQAKVVPYKPRDPIAELVAQLPENQKEI